MATMNQIGLTLSGQTGTGTFVGSTGPTLSGPLSNNIRFSATNAVLDNNGNVSLALTSTGSAVNYFTLANSATGNAISLTASGSDTNIGLSLISKGTGGVILQGTGTNDSAAAGKVGEYISSTVLIGSAITLNTTATAYDVTSISLTAGDWTVFGNVGFLSGSATTVLQAWASTTSATLVDAALRQQITGTLTSGGNYGMSICPIRVSVAATTTVYLSVRSVFTGTDPTAGGIIFARRDR